MRWSRNLRIHPRKSWILGILMMVITIGILPMQALAIEKIDEDADVSLTVEFQTEEGPLQDVVFKVYKVADMKGYGELEITDVFAMYPVILPNADSEDETSLWKSAAQTWAAYARMDGIEPVDTGVTDANGMIRFPEGTARMTPGLYLVVGTSCATEDTLSTSEPSLLSLPMRDDKDQWQYDQTIYPKYARDRLEIQTAEVMKIWKDEGNKKNRPEEIQIQLLKDGVAYETVLLSKDNNWRYIWQALEAGAEWKVVEKEVPKDYTVSIEQQGTTFTVTNTYAGEETPEDSKLPQSGVLWWPVPVLAILGMLFFIIGWIRYQKQ